jgi:hypothetical protein
MLTLPRAEGSWQPPPDTEVSYFGWGRYIHSPGMRAIGTERRPESESAYSSVPVSVTHLPHPPLDIAVLTGEEAETFLPPLLAQPDRLVVARTLPEDAPGYILDRLEATWLDLAMETETAIFDAMRTAYQQRYTSLGRAVLSGEACGLVMASTELWANSWQTTNISLATMVFCVWMEASRRLALRRGRKNLPDHEVRWGTISNRNSTIALLEIYDTYSGRAE